MQVGKGKIFLVNGNPLFKGAYNKIFYNYLFVAMSRNVMMDAYVGTPNNLPLPGGEAGYQLNLKVSFINLYDTAVNNPSLNIYLHTFCLLLVIPSFCLPDATNMTEADPTT